MPEEGGDAPGAAMAHGEDGEAPGEPREPAEPADPYAALRRSSAFEGVDPADFDEVIRELDGRIAAYGPGESVRHTGDEVRGIFIVLEGRVRVGMLLHDREMNIERFGPGQVFGEAIAFSTGPHNAPVEITSEQDSRVLYIEAASFARCAGGSGGMRVYANLMGGISAKMLQLNTKIRILGKQRVRDKLATYLVSLPGIQGGRASIPLTRTALAEYLGVDRSSLARELKALQAEGVVEVSGTRVRVLDADRLADLASR